MFQQECAHDCGDRLFLELLVVHLQINKRHVLVTPTTQDAQPGSIGQTQTHRKELGTLAQ